MKKGLVILGAGLLIFGLGTLSSSFVLPIKTSVEWYTKVGCISSLGAVFVMCGVYLDKVKTLFNLITPAKTIVAKEEKPDIAIDLDVSMEKDYQCINYLSRRFKSMKNEKNKSAGLDNMAQVHGLLYKDYHLEENTSTDNTPTA